MALFQDYKEDGNIVNHTVEPDTFSKLGFDEIVEERRINREQQAENERLWVSNIVSPERIKEWENKGKMTAIEVWQKKNKNELIPYMGTWQEGTETFGIKNISDKLKKGQVVSPEERQKYEDFILDMAEIQTRGYTFGGGATNIGLETLPFMAEFGIGLLTTGGTASIGATTSKIGVETVKKTVKQKIAEGVKKTAFNATLNPKTYAFTATRLPQQVRARMGDIMLSDSIAITPEGQAILKEGETSPAIAFMKALAMTNVEVASEISGAMLVRPVMQGAGQLSKAIASPVLKHLPDGFAEKFVKLAEEATKLPFAKAVDELGFNGVLEEIGEERVGDLLKFALNIDEEEGYSFEQLLDAVFPSAEQLGQEALSFGVTGVAMNVAHAGLKSLPKVGEKYTKDGFLIDAGIFRTHGYDSYLDSKVKEELTKKGKTEDEIENVLDFSTRDDKIQFLKESKTEFDSKKQYNEKELEKELKRIEVEDVAFEKLTQGGVDKDVAFANAKLFGQFFKQYGANNPEAFKEWFNKFDVQYNVPANGKKVVQFQGVQNAGAEKNESIDAQKEWKEKGTESKYFKNWFGDSKVVDENGQPLVVYHGTSEFFSEFDSSLSNYGEVSKDFNFFTNKMNAYANSAKDYSDYWGKRNNQAGWIHEVYLSIKNPLHIKYTNTSESSYFTPVEYYDYNFEEIKEQYYSGNYDGIIIENTDKNSDDSIIYAVPNSEQIKSIGNQGTFDAENPNIYFQSAYHGTPHKFDKFSLGAIGAGEGNQAHGWGLYFAENKDVSENYRRGLVDKNKSSQYTYDGKPIEETKFKDVDSTSLSWILSLGKERVLEEIEEDIEYIIKWGKENEGKQRQEILDGNSKYLIKKQKELELVKELNPEKLQMSAGQLYEVDIPENEVLLDEQKTFAEQSETVQKAFIKIFEERYQNLDFMTFKSNVAFFDIKEIFGTKYVNEAFEKFKANMSKYIPVFIKNYTGEQLYQALSYKVGGDKNASLKLNEVGIKGITYNGREDGRCYVIFDDKAIDVIKTYYQDSNEEEKLIAGFTYPEVLDKMTEIYAELEKGLPEKEEQELMAKLHVLEDAFEVSENPQKFSNEERQMEIMLNAYYIMNNQEIPKDYLETDSISKRTYDDLRKLHIEKKEKAEAEYYGYFTEGQNKNVITIMANHNSSTALHELGHLFLNGLNELARADENARQQLDAVNKWLGFSGEYTVAQQEKFARSFEAYLYKGKAPNNALRQVFENFK